MKKTFCLLIMIISVLLTSVTAFALTEGDWQYEIKDSKITITGYVGDGGDVVVPQTIRNCPVVDVNMDHGWDGNAKSVTSITFPEGVIKISLRVCNEMTNLKKLNFPQSLTEIGYLQVGMEELDFSNCQSLKFTPELDVFRSLSLKKVVLPPGMTTISCGMFAGCFNLEEVVLPDTITVIETSAFQNCTSLKRIIFPKSLKTIGPGAFYCCDSLEEIILPYGVETIGEKAFDGQQIKTVYIPETVVNFPRYNFPRSNYSVLAPIMNEYNFNIDELLIICSKGSAAEAYLKEYNGYSYIFDNTVNDKIIVSYNGSRISFHEYGQGPMIINNRTMVPLRSIFEAMGAKVTWDDSTKTVTATRKKTTVKITVGSHQMYVNNKEIALDVPAQIINGRTMVPVRAISEAFKANVEWNGAGNTVLISE